MVDSYISELFEVKNEQFEIPLERIQEDQNLEEGVLSINYEFDFHQINVEEVTGRLFTTQQVENKHEAIQHSVIDGGRSFYIPIWHDLGSYPLMYKSESFGANLIKIEMVQAIDIYALMYATIDSETLQLDELLLEPIYPESLAPEGWTVQEIEWLLK